MLSVFRKGGAAQTLIGVIVALIIVVFVVEFRAAGGQGSGKIEVVCAVKVGTRCVSEKDFFAAQRIAAWDGMEPKQMKELDFERRVAEGLIERELLVAEAERLGLGIGDQEVEDELEAGRVRVSMPARDLEELSQRLGLCNWVPNPLVADPERARKMAICDPNGPRGVRAIEVKSRKTGRFDYKIYERTIRIRANRSPREFRESQRQELIAERMREVIRTSVHVAESETWLAYERENSTAVIDRVDVPSSWFARFLVSAPDNEVDDWAAANQPEVDEAWKSAKDSFKAECPLVSEIVTRFDATTTDADKVQLRAKLEAAKQELERGAPFARLARETSDGDVAIYGGEVGCLEAAAYGEGGEALVEAVKALAVGETTPILETTGGFHLLRVDARPAAATVEAMGRRVIARRRYVNFKATGLAQRFGDDVVAAVRGGEPVSAAVERLTRAAAAAAAGQPVDAKDAAAWPSLSTRQQPRVERSEPFARLGRPMRDAIAGNVAGLAFALDKPGAVHPSPIPTRRGFAVMVLVEKKVADKAEFAKVRLDAMRDRQRVKADEALADYVAALRKAAEQRIVIDPSVTAPSKDGEADPE